jgi:AcrR family transcriptional regulator
MSPENDARRRILDAAFAAFMETGYAETSTLEIARRARVSKRELYALVGNKQEMLVACIRERATRLRAPGDLPQPADRAALERALAIFGAQLLRETTNETVIAVYRLAIAEAVRTPEVAEALETLGRRSGRAAVVAILSDARGRGLLGGDPEAMAERFTGLLWGDLMVGLLLRVVATPGSDAVDSRAAAAASTFLALYPEP